MTFITQFKVYSATYRTLCCAFAKQHIITTAMIFSFHNNTFLITDVSLLKFVAFNVAVFDVALSKVALFDAALYDVELF